MYFSFTAMHGYIELLHLYQVGITLAQSHKYYITQPHLMGRSANHSIVYIMHAGKQCEKLTHVLNHVQLLSNRN